MSELVVSDFPGLAFAKRSAEPGGVTYAEQASNVDTSGGTVRPCTADSFEEGGHSEEITKLSGSYYSGGSNYLQWIADEQDVLIYKKSGSWKQYINGVERDISLPSPAVATLTDLSLDIPSAVTVTTVDDNVTYLENKDYVYYITFSKIVDGQELESDPSVAISTPNYVPRYHVIPRPTTVPSNATNWNVYRSDNGDTARLIMSAGAVGTNEGFSFVTDKLVSSARGRNITSTSGRLRFEYVLSWKRVTGGRTEESGPSVPVGIEVNTLGVKVTRPLSTPAGVTHWNIYRISTLFDATTAFQLLAEVAIATSTYEDFTSNAALGAVLPSRYTAYDGTITVLEAPEVVFTGMAGPFSGYFVGWKDNALYLSEPGYVHLWSSVYSFYCNAPIVSVTQNGSDLNIMTTKGVQRAYGTSPITTALTPGVNGGGAVSRRTCIATDYGTIYLTKNGLSLVSGSQITDISKSIGEAYFKTLTPVQLEYQDQTLYYFHTTGALVYDLDDQKFTTLTGVYSAAYASDDDGEIYVLQSTSIKQLFGSATALTQTYRTGEWVLSQPQHKKFRSLWFSGTGTLMVSVYKDGDLSVTQAIDMDGVRADRLVNIQHGITARALSIKVSGTGELKEIRADVLLSE